jgi:tRNA-2-methylthio-N6-dimethylallyladenosine synthase
VTSYGKRWNSSFSSTGGLASLDTLKRELQQTRKSAFVQLLEASNDDRGLERIRLLRRIQKVTATTWLRLTGRCRQLCESAHLPVQSGSDRILKTDAPRLHAQPVLALVGKLRQVNPEMGITTDIIVGFPGETDADFEETLSR